MPTPTPSRIILDSATYERQVAATKRAARAWTAYLDPERAVAADGWFELTEAMQALVLVAAEMEREGE